MSTDLDPRKQLLQYGALGAVCVILLAIVGTAAAMITKRHLLSLDRQDAREEKRVRLEERIVQTQARTLEELVEVKKGQAQIVNEVLSRVRITGRR